MKASPRKIEWRLLTVDVLQADSPYVTVKQFAAALDLVDHVWLPAAPALSPAVR
jgi:hypothetical protein